MTKKATAGFGAIGVNAETIRGEIFSCVQRAGARGVTCDEVEDRLFLPHQTASARIRELAGSRVIVETGDKRTTRHGRKARVYRVSSATEVFTTTATGAPAGASLAW